MTWSGLLDDVGDLLRDWPTSDPGRAPLLERYRQVAARDGVGALRKGDLPHHFTAAVVVLDDRLERVLLTHHRKAGAWLQFGGHLEAGDATIEAAARREGTEESGIALTRQLVPVELDAHRLGAGFGACAEHLDLRWVTTVPGDAVPVTSDESHDVAWFEVDALPSDIRAEVRDLIEKAVAVARASEDLRVD